FERLDVVRTLEQPRDLDRVTDHRRVCQSVSRRALDRGNRLGEVHHGFVDMPHARTEERSAGSKGCTVEVELAPASALLLELLAGVGPASVAHESELVRHHGELQACLEWHGKAICQHYAAIVGGRGVREVAKGEVAAAELRVPCDRLCELSPSERRRRRLAPERRTSLQLAAKEGDVQWAVGTVCTAREEV